MGAYKVILSKLAESDLEKIVRHIAQDNPGAAERLGLKLIDRALGLSVPGSAFMGTALRKRPEVRRLVEGNYLILYRVLPRKKIRILRFWHAARDPKKMRMS